MRNIYNVEITRVYTVDNDDLEVCSIEEAEVFIMENPQEFINGNIGYEHHDQQVITFTIKNHYDNLHSNTKAAIDRMNSEEFVGAAADIFDRMSDKERIEFFKVIK